MHSRLHITKYTAGSQSRLHTGRNVAIAKEDVGDIAVYRYIGHAPAQ